MHTVLAFKGKLIASVVFMHHFYIGSKKDVNHSRPHVLNGQHLLIIAAVVLAIFRLKPSLYVFNVILLH